MAKLYTLDKKLITGVPEIRIGEEIFPIDNRTSTVKKLLKKLNSVDSESEEVIDSDELIIRAAFNKNAEKILEMDMSFKAQTELSAMALSIMTGEEPEMSRFQQNDGETQSE